jgi:hypothetical protein
MLVYCPQCRLEHQHMIDVSVPMELVTPETLVGLYQMRKTSSDPATVLDVILGVKGPGLFKELVAAMERQNAG